jgi:hypothetical protein
MGTLAGAMTAALTKRRPIEWAAFFEACGELLIARLQLAFLPFRTVERKLRRAPAVLASIEDGRADARRLVTWAIEAVARRSPVPFLCFPQAIAAQAMLRRRGVAIDIHYGVARDHGRQVRTHVWAMDGVHPVAGFRAAQDFTTIHVFRPGDPARAGVSNEVKRPFRI